MNFNTKFAITALSICASTFTFASDSLTFQGLTYGGGTDTATINGNGYYAGPFNVTLNGGQTFQTFCADVNDETVFNVATPVTIEDAANLGAPYQKAAQLYNAFAPAAGTNVLKNAGLQVAIWDVLFSGNTYGDFWQSGVIAQADADLAANVSSYSDHATIYSFGGHNQDQIGASPQAVPEPCTMAVMGLGVIGFIKRRANKKG